MKRSLLIISVIFSFINVFSINATWNYTVTGGPSNPVSMAGATSLSLYSGNYDDGGFLLQWPFNFQIYNDVYTTSNNIYGCTNGFLRFDGAISQSVRTGQIPTNSAAYGQFLSYGGDSDGKILSGGIVYKVTGTTGSRVLTIAFTYSTHYNISTAYKADVQISFYEASHNIRVNYNNVSGSTQYADELGMNAGDNVFGTDVGVFPHQDTSFLFLPGGSINPPQSFSATVVSSYQINLSWQKNSNGNDVIIATNTANNFGTPTNGISYSAGQPLGAATIIYTGSSTSFQHMNLLPNSHYYYKIWSKTSTNSYSSAALTDDKTTNPLLLITINGPSLICQGDSVELTTNNNSSYTYQWIRNGQNITGATSYSYFAKQTGVYKVKITINGSDTILAPVNITIDTSINNINFYSSLLNLIYPNITASFVNLTPNISSLNFEWNFGDNNSISSNNYITTHSYTQNGTFDVKLKATNLVTGCSDSIIKQNYIHVSGIGTACIPFNPVISPPGYTSEICPGDSILLSANSGNGFSYQWFKNGYAMQGDTLQSLIATSQGTYSVIIDYVNDTCPGKMSFPKIVNNYQTTKPALVNDTNFVSCSNDSIHFYLTNSNLFNGFHWYNGATSQDIYLKNTSNVSLYTTDLNGCKTYSDTIFFDADYEPVKEICLVTLDSLFIHNQITWSAPAGNIDSVYIYRETSLTGIYIKAGQISAQGNTAFTDLQSNATMREYRYIIKVKDSCGTYSDFSSPHKTIHLTINKGTGNNYNLIWNPYEGNTIISYYIYRGTSQNHLTLYDSVPANTLMISDNNLPSPNMYYAIKAKVLTPCGSVKGSNNYQYVSSNIVLISTVGLGSDENKYNFTVKPNPSNGIFYLNTSGYKGRFTYIITNSLGQIIKQVSFTKTNSSVLKIDLSQSPKGLYFMKLMLADSNVTLKLIKTH